jgi:hypothetical protein
MTIRLDKVDIVETDRSTIMLGFLIGSARVDEDTDIDITGSGRTVRFRCKHKGVMREFDLDLTDLAKAVVDECKSPSTEKVSRFNG